MCFVIAFLISHLFHSHDQECLLRDGKQEIAFET